MPNRSVEDVRKSFALRRAVFWVLALGLGVLLAMFTLASEDGEPTGNLAFVGVSGILVYALYSLIAWRCPACDSHLGNSMNPASCPSCGTDFG